MRLPEDLAVGHKVVRNSLAFSPEMLVATVGVAGAVSSQDMVLGRPRYLYGDWGDVDSHDWCANDQSLRVGTRIVSAYVSSTGVKYWIITEADRSATTFLLPDEY
jgi:hypothetical protein